VKRLNAPNDSREIYPRSCATLLHRKASLFGAAVVLCFVGVSQTPASQTAFDSAGDSAYNTGWPLGSNGGYGWAGGWGFGAQPVEHVIGSSTAGGFGDINSPRTPNGRSWELVYQGAIRYFSAPLLVGQSFSADLAGTGGWDMIIASTFHDVADVRSDGSQYLVYGAVTITDTGVPVTSAALHYSLTVLDATTYQVSLSLLDSRTPLFQMTETTPYALALDSFQPDGGEPFYFNNIEITPEPSVVVFLGLAGLGFLCGGRRIRSAGCSIA